MGTGVIALELRRSDAKDREKKAREAAYRERIDQDLREERQVLFRIRISTHFALTCEGSHAGADDFNGQGLTHLRAL